MARLSTAAVAFSPLAALPRLRFASLLPRPAVARSRSARFASASEFTRAAPPVSPFVLRLRPAPAPRLRLVAAALRQKPLLLHRLRLRPLLLLPLPSPASKALA